jgi:hypothetical protein
MLVLKDEKINATIHDELLISTNKTIDISPLKNLCGLDVMWDVKQPLSNWKEAKS